MVVPGRDRRLADVLGQGEETGFRPAHAYRLIAALLQPLSSAPPGRHGLHTCACRERDLGTHITNARSMFGCTAGSGCVPVGVRLRCWPAGTC